VLLTTTDMVSHFMKKSNKKTSSESLNYYCKKSRCVADPSGVRLAEALARLPPLCMGSLLLICLSPTATDVFKGCDAACRTEGVERALRRGPTTDRVPFEWHETEAWAPSPG